MTTVGYISDTEEVVKASWSLFRHDGASAFKLAERSPLPPALSATDLLGGRTAISNVHAIRRTNCPPVESDNDSAPKNLSDTDDWLNWNGDLDNPNHSKEDCSADYVSDIEHNNHIEDPECPEQHDVSAALNVLGLVQPIRKSQREADNVLVTVNAAEMRRNNRGKKNYDTMRQDFTSLL
jgi:hypothetical protein